MRFIDISGKKGHGLRAIVDDEDYEEVRALTWCLNSAGYPYAYIGGGRKHQKMIGMHQFVARPPKGMVVDHINRDKFDNRKANLRICTRGQNRRNSGPKSGEYKFLSKYKGVYRNKAKTKFVARLYFIDRPARKQRMRYLGTFTTEEEAARAYDRGAREQFGEYAYQNLQ